MQFQTQFRNRTVTVDWSGWSDPDSLEGVEIRFPDGSEIDYDTLGTTEWFDIWSAVCGERQASLIDWAMDYDR